MGIKDRVNSINVRDMEELKNRIKDVISNIPREMCVKALNSTVDRCFLFLFFCFFLCINRAGGQVETVQ